MIVYMTKISFDHDLKLKVPHMGKTLEYGVVQWVMEKHGRY